MKEIKHYGEGDTRCSYSGVGLEEAELKNKIASEVKTKIYDKKGTEELLQSLDGITKTGFQKEKLVNILKLDQDVQDWRIGEALAECYLEENKSCRFYYEYIRDAKNPNASLNGADLVGFVKLDGNYILLFGEIKTSSHDLSPPSVLNGRSGLIKQLEDLKNKEEIRNNLIRWLGMKTINLPDNSEFKERYRNAVSIYISEEKGKIKTKLIGVLVRDTSPNSLDLSNRFRTLVKDLENTINIELIALYLPVKVDSLKNILSGKIGT